MEPTVSKDTVDSNLHPQPCIVIRFNHFDPIWRRCWDRHYYNAGRKIVSYRAIEEAWIDDAIASCADGVSCFMVEASWALSHYLERHPEHVETLRKLTSQNRFELLGSGENIVDTNMIHGELLARNLILGTLWGQKTLGVRPTSGWVQDTFGASAQLPQIFRQCGYQWLAWIIYDLPDQPYWRGLDGSVIYIHREDRDRLATYSCSPGYGQQMPCPACQGNGCGACRYRGFQEGVRAEFANPPKGRKPFSAGVMWLYGEEVLPGFHVAKDLCRFQASTTEFSVRQGTFRDVAAFVADELARVDNPPEDQVSSDVENNPVFSGCYVTRIRMKQEHRAAEHALLAAERWDTVLNGSAHADWLRDAWRKMTLSAFHDAITSTHCDAAYEELMDLLADVKLTAGEISIKALTTMLQPHANAFTVFNGESFTATAPVTVTIPGKWDGAMAMADGKALPVYEVTALKDRTTTTFLACDVPALGAKTVILSPAADRTQALAEGEVSCERYKLQAAKHGISEVTLQKIGPITDASKFMFGELILEADFGNPWYTATPDRTRARLSPYTRLDHVRAHGDSVVITYIGDYPDKQDPLVKSLRWRQVFRLRKGLPYIEVETTVDWYTHSRRLRLAFPSRSKLNRGVYEIPYGVLERDRYDVDNSFFKAGGDWPAIHWAGIQVPDYIFAVFNQGTPSYRVEDGTIMVSLLRSPQSAAYQIIMPLGQSEATHVQPNSSPVHYHGMMDHGKHVFHHALYVADGHWSAGDVGRQAEMFNAGLQVQAGVLKSSLPLWQWEAAHTQITAIKAAEDGKGIVVRMVEQSGRPEVVRLHIPANFHSAYETNLLEEPLRELALTDGWLTLSIAPWKIISIKLVGENQRGYN